LLKSGVARNAFVGSGFAQNGAVASATLTTSFIIKEKKSCERAFTHHDIDDIGDAPFMR
jgi:hypothetical protein